MYETIPKMVMGITRDYPDTVAQYSKDDRGHFLPTTFSELLGEVKSFAAGLYDIGVRRGDNIGLISDNRKEWLIADLASQFLGAVDVPRGRDSMPQEIQYILHFAECRITFAENLAQAEKILALKESLPQMEALIVLDSDFTPDQLEGDTTGLTIYTFANIMQGGKAYEKDNVSFVEKEAVKGNPDDTATIIFTSGTTGEPKGVMLTHKAYIHQVEGVKEVVDIKPGDIWLSVLPVWHSFERILQYAAIGTASTLAYSKPIGKIMLQDFQKIKPMWMGSVPRIWEAIKAGILRNVGSKGIVSRGLFHFFVWIGGSYAYCKDMFLKRLPRFKKRNRILDVIVSIIPLLLLTPFKFLGDVLVFSSIREKLGGRFRAGVSGGGSLPSSVDSFFQAAGVRLLNGYGLTETGPVIALRNFFRPVPFSMDPFPGTEIKIVDENGKDVPPNRKGVVLARGHQVMKGYYQRDDLTRQMIDNEGWCNTGDIGVWTYDGEFDIRGRAKDTIVLFGGENIEPAPIESKLRESAFIEQAMIIGQDEKFLGALIVPDLKEIEVYFKDNGIPYVSRSHMIEMTETIELINSEIQGLISAKNGFKSYERISRFELVPWSFEIGKELSAKQEIKRHIIAEKYKKQIEKLFS